MKIKVQDESELQKHAAKSKNCGQCALTCPTHQVGLFNPLGVLRALQMGKINEAIEKWDIFNCLCCNRCMVECPSAASTSSSNNDGMNFANLMRELRAYALKNGYDLFGKPKAEQIFLHIHENVKSLKESEYKKELKKKTTLKFEEKSEFAYFPGNLNDDNGTSYLEIAESVIKILNKLSIKPAIIESAGSGHDDYWAGNYEVFQEIAQNNLSNIIKSGAKTIIVEDSETFHTLKCVYPLILKDFDKMFNIMHLSQFLLEEERYKKFYYRPNFNFTLAIHDSSRLGRMGEGIYEPLRKLFQIIPGITVKELDNNKETSYDLGTGIMIEPGEKLEKMWDIRKNEIESDNIKYLLTPSIKAYHLLQARIFDPFIKEWAVFYSKCII